MITLDDLRRGRIDHALAVGLPAAIVRGPAYSWPAQRTDGTSTDPASIPEGAHFRLDPTLDLSTLDLSPAARMIAEAAQRYGIVVRDRSGDVTLYGEDPTPTGADPYPAFLGGQSPLQALQGIPWDRLQLVQMRLSGGPPVA
jgi:hypothetical protein